MPQKGGKSTQSGQHRLVSTEFGQLETTPTCRHLESPENHLTQKPASESQDEDNSSQTGCVENLATNQKQQSSFVDEFDDEIDDVDLIDVDLISVGITDELDSQPVPAKNFSWSETGSLTRPSSPLHSSEASNGIWQFDNQASLIDAFSSPKSGQGNPPKTQPLTQSLNAHLEESLNQAVVSVDFSETASTARRSSPFPFQIAVEESWRLNSINKTLLSSTVPDSAQLSEMAPYPPEKPGEHLPADELYDATPPRSSAQRPVAPLPKRPQAPRESERSHRDPIPLQVKKTKRGPPPPPKTSKRSLAKYIEDTDLVEDEDASIPSPKYPEPREAHQKRNKTSALQEKEPNQDEQATPPMQDDPGAGPGQKRKKRKQRAKTPIQFDNETQAIKEVAQQKKKNAEPRVRMPLVNAMKRSSGTSSSPVISARKKAAPKATRKVAPKSTPKPPFKPVTRKALPRKKRKMPVEEDEDDSVIIVDTDFTEHKPANNTTARKVTQPKTKATRGQQGPEINAGSQGSSRDPIVVASDPASSAISEDESKRTELPRPSQVVQAAAQESMAGSDMMPTVTPDTSLEHVRDQQAAMLPQECPSSVAPKPSRTLREKEAIVDTKAMNAAASKEPAEEPINLRKRSRETSVKPLQALSYRDPNIPVKSALRTTRGPGISTRDTPPRVNKAGFVQRRKSSKISRSFSISQAGSPVPVETGQGRLIDESSLMGAESPRLNDRNLDKEPCGPRRSQRLRRPEG